MNYWLFKSEPTCFSIDDLSHCPKQTTHWDGVRNYQVRNFLRDKMKVGDLGFFYHSSCNPPGIAGVIEVVKDGYPDPTAWDLRSDHYDPKSDPDHPRWYMVDVRLVKKFSQLLALDEMKRHPKLKNMLIMRKGNRLSITPLTKEEWKIIYEHARA
jgi:predicted RNA-binding protein with PUA-like domain